MALDRLNRIKLAVEAVVLLDKLAPVIGLGSLSGVLWGLWASLNGPPPVQIGLVIFAGITLTVLLINGIRAYLRATVDRLISESFRAWSLLEKIAILDAAKILARSYDEKLVRPYFRMLKERADSGKIKAEKAADNTGNHNKWSLIPKEELLRIGRELGRDNLF